MIYIYEIYLTFKLKPVTIFEIYEKHKKKNLNFFPHFRQRLFTTSNQVGFKNEVFTLAGISDVSLIMTNENGFYPVSKHDNYGWANIKPDYKNFEIALIGDSFVEGYSVEQENTIVERLNKKNLKAISFGFAGNHPLYMYASFVEHIEKFNPKKIIWFLTDFQLHDLQLDKENKYLKKYIEDNNFNQNLIYRQTEIDDLMKQHSLEMWKETKKTRSRKHNYLRMIRLAELRESLGLFYSRKVDHSSKTKNKKDINCVKDKYNFNLSQETIELYEKILINLKNRTNKNNSKLYVVYLPSKLVFDGCMKNNDNLAASKYFSNFNIIKDQIISNEIVFLDMKNKIEMNINNPLEIYSGHFNAKGYQFVADQIVELINNKS